MTSLARSSRNSPIMILAPLLFSPFKYWKYIYPRLEQIVVHCRDIINRWTYTKLCIIYYRLLLLLCYYVVVTTQKYGLSSSNFTGLSTWNSIQKNPISKFGFFFSSRSLQSELLQFNLSADVRNDREMLLQRKCCWESCEPPGKWYHCSQRGPAVLTRNLRIFVPFLTGRPLASSPVLA